MSLDSYIGPGKRSNQLDFRIGHDQIQDPGIFLKDSLTMGISSGVCVL